MTHEQIRQTPGAKAAKYAKSLCKSIIPTEYIFAQNSSSNCENHTCLITGEKCVGSHQQFDGEGGHPMYISWYSTYLEPKDVENCPMSYLSEQQASSIRNRREQLFVQNEQELTRLEDYAELLRNKNILTDLKSGKKDAKKYLTSVQEREIEMKRLEIKAQKREGLAAILDEIEIQKHENVVADLEKRIGK